MGLMVFSTPNTFILHYYTMETSNLQEELEQYFVALDTVEALERQLERPTREVIDVTRSLTGSLC